MLKEEGEDVAGDVAKGKDTWISNYNTHQLCGDKIIKLQLIDVLGSHLLDLLTNILDVPLYQKGHFLMKCSLKTCRV